MLEKRRQNNAICPYCDSKMRVIKVVRVSPLLTVRSYACTNEHYECGAIIEYGDSPMRLLSPSSRNKEGIDIPLATRAEKKPMAK